MNTESFSPFEQAGRHPITFSGPAEDFFEGALLGNGGLGCVVVTRPNTLLLHFGHNNVWDIRIAEDHAEEIGTFRKIFDRVNSIDPTLRWIEITSEAGRPLRIHNPWNGPAVCIRAAGRETLFCDILEIATEKGETFRLAVHQAGSGSADGFV